MKDKIMDLTKSSKLNKLNGLDLFSGIGGISMGLSQWVEPIAYCEKDRYCQNVLLSRMSDGHIKIAPIWDDITTLLPSMLPRKGIDIIYGGFPCQDISVANTNGKGLEGKRSGLFFEILRLSKEIKPTFIFLENVPNIRTRGLSTVGKELAGLGYDCRWGIVSAAEIGARHIRKRWFLLAHSKCERGRANARIKRATENECQKLQQKNRQALSNDSKQICRNVPNSDGKGLEGQCKSKRVQKKHSNISLNSWWEIEPNVDRVVNELSFRVDRIKALGNAVVPSQVSEAFKRLMGIKNV
jgi:DNA (cytosine-5)-methyltransferase 1